MKKFNLTITEYQAGILVRALDLYSRIGIGQYEEIASWEYEPLNEEGELATLCCASKQKEAEVLRQILSAAKFLRTGQPQNGSFGIHHPQVQDKFRAAYDIQQIVRNSLWKEKEDKSTMTVDNSVFKTSKQDLPEMEPID